jgi:hypothetical protein
VNVVLKFQVPCVIKIVSEPTSQPVTDQRDLVKKIPSYLASLLVSWLLAYCRISSIFCRNI